MSHRFTRSFWAVVCLLGAGCIALPDALPPVDEMPAEGPDAEPTIDAAVSHSDATVDPDSPDMQPDQGRIFMDEVCNGVDDDGDGAADEGVTNLCGVCGPLPEEVCDAIDNNCNLVVDEAADCDCAPGTTEACGADIGQCEAGTRDCGPDGSWGMCDALGPESETCNGLDDDCDGDTDENLLNACRACGPVPDEVCNGVDDDCDGAADEGVLNDCGRCGPAPDEVCNDTDDDCDGSIDEGVRNACGGCGAVQEACNALDDDCDGTTDEGVQNDCGGCGPPPLEVCNQTDDDCDGDVDEDACDCQVGSTRPCGPSDGRCERGQQRCTVDGWGDCTGGVTPRGERCDGIDDDCDGRVDEDFGELGDPCVVGRGACRAAGEVICLGDDIVGCDVEPAPPGDEACNDRDDDCDGSIDEGTGGRVCDTGEPGVCAEGAEVCTNGNLVCDQESSPRAETCDRVDDDCDGRLDEGTGGDDCDTGDPGRCAPGARQCAGGNLTCVANLGPTVESCNRIDDDCDGTTDENPLLPAECETGSPGRCSQGTPRCIDGDIECVGPNPLAETCDGSDEDCDGTTDEGTDGGECETGQPGRCASGTRTCDGGGLECIRNNNPRSERCDAIDDDCDGAVDEDIDLSMDEQYQGGCDTDLPGACRNGEWGCDIGRVVCVQTTSPVAEQCNNRDDDCDGTTDESAMLPRGCDTGLPGPCGDGTPRCTNGAIECVPPAAQIERCDGVDNDCDGDTDERLDGVACDTGQQGVCANGRTMCVLGQASCDPITNASPEGSGAPGSCNGVDDDCDGRVDEQWPGRRDCGGQVQVYCRDGQVSLCPMNPGPTPEPAVIE